MDKTPLILFKSPRKKLPDDLKLVLDGVPITPLPHVKLLGVILDHNFTHGEQIDNVVNKCNGVPGMLARSAPYLPRKLLHTVYTLR